MRTGWVMAVWAAGCSAAPIHVENVKQLDALHRGAPREMPEAIAVVPHAETRSQPGLGDSVVFSLERRASGESRCWFVRITVVEYDPAATGRVTHSVGGVDEGFMMRGRVGLAVEVTGADGEPLSASYVSGLASEHLQSGFAAGCRAMRPFRDVPDDGVDAVFRGLPAAQREDCAVAILSSRSLLNVISSNPSLGPLLQEAARVPSLGSILTRFHEGVLAEFSFRDARLWPDCAVVDTRESFVVPLQLFAFGELALDGSMVVVDSTRPMHPAAGVVSIVGVHPSDAESTVVLRLLAVGRVTGAAWRGVVALREDAAAR